MPKEIQATHILGVITAIVVFIAAFLPWASVDLVFASVSRSGIDYDDGIITLIIAVVAVGAILWSTQRPKIGWAITFLAGAMIAIVGLVDMADVGSTDGVDVGIGLIFTFLGGMALIVISIFGFRQAL